MSLTKNGKLLCWAKRMLKQNPSMVILQEKFNSVQPLPTYSIIISTKTKITLWMFLFWVFPKHSFCKKKILVLFSFSLFCTSHLSKCQPLIPVALLVYPLNLNLFLTLLVLSLTTIESCCSRKSIQNIVIPNVLGEYALADFQFFLVFIYNCYFSLNILYKTIWDSQAYWLNWSCSVNRSPIPFWDAL